MNVFIVIMVINYLCYRIVWEFGYDYLFVKG